MPQVNVESLCEKGFLPPLCQDSCNGTFWGDDCSNECHCFEGALCDAASGECPSTGQEHVCDAGWIGASCNTTCSYRTYGLGCEQNCGSCFGNNSCNNINGECLKSEAEDKVCENGFVPPMCLEKKDLCSPGFFGANCENVCNCEVKESCNSTTGFCSDDGCLSGWLGER